MKIDNLGSVGTSVTPYKSLTTDRVADAPSQPPAPLLEGDAVHGAKVDAVNDHDWKTANQEETITPEMMDRAMRQANKALGGLNKAIERTVHDKTHTVMYVLRDTVTKEVIREFPPKKIQDMIAKMWELAGLFVDEKG